MYVGYSYSLCLRGMILGHQNINILRKDYIMDVSIERRFRQKLIVELNGFKHNLYSDSQKYRITQKVLYEAKRTEIPTADLLYKYADFFVKNGISVLEILDEVI